MKKYNVGDKVRVVETPNPWWNDGGKMNRWCGKEVTIRRSLFDGRGYWIVEDKDENDGFGWCWADVDFEDITETKEAKEAKEAKPAKKPMPTLTTGMFGKVVEADGSDDLFVVVGDMLVFQQSGLCDFKDIFDEFGSCISYKITELYESDCFSRIDDCDAKVIWSRDGDSEIKDDKDDKDDKDNKTALIDLLELIDLISDKANKSDETPEGDDK